MIRTTTNAEIYEVRVWIVIGESVQKWRCGGYGSSSDVSFCPSVSFSSLLSLSFLWILAQYKWRRHGFVPPANRGGVSLCTRSTERLPLSCTDWLWDIRVRTIAYIERLFDYSLSFPFIPLSCTGFGSPGGLCLKRGIMWRRHMTRGRVSASVYRLQLRHLDEYQISYHSILHIYSLTLLCKRIPLHLTSAVKRRHTCLYSRSPSGSINGFI